MEATEIYKDTRELNQLVIPLTEEPGTDMYWHEWLVIEFPDFYFDRDYAREKLEPVVRGIPFEEYDYENDEELDMQPYIEKLVMAFADMGLTATATYAKLAFTGE